MKLSLWQQFSSNHSGFFWVVGTFASMSEAKNAYDTLRQMLITIDHWHQEHPQDSGNSIDPVPPEREFAARYDVNWPMTIDWTGWASYGYDHPSLPPNYASDYAARLIDAAVMTVGRIVIVQNPDQTWMLQQPFAGLLSKLGAQTFGYDLESLHIEGWPESYLSFTAPDEATANRLETSLNTYLAGDLASLDNPPPWNDDEQNYVQVLGKSVLLNVDVIRHLQKQWQTRATSSFITPATEEMPSKRLALLGKPSAITRENLGFMLKNVHFHNELLGIHALIAWLEVNGCIEIDFIYQQEG